MRLRLSFSADSVTTARDAGFLRSLKIQSELFSDEESAAEMTAPGLFDEPSNNPD